MRGELNREQIRTRNGRILGNKYEIIDGNLAFLYTNKGEKIIVSFCDLPELLKHTWLLNNQGYAYSRSYNRKAILLHRFIMGVLNNKNVEIDHINRNPLDNTRSNLRIVDRVTNCRNTKIEKKTKSGYRGIFFRKDTKKWSVHIKVNYRKISLGCFDKLEDAIERRKIGEIEYWGS